MGVSRQIRHEALSVVCAVNNIFAYSFENAKWFMEYVGPAREHIRRLSLCCFNDLTIDPGELFSLLADCKRITHLKVFLDGFLLVDDLGLPQPLSSIALVPEIAWLRGLRGLDEVEIRWKHPSPVKPTTMTWQFNVNRWLKDTLLSPAESNLEDLQLVD